MHRYLGIRNWHWIQVRTYGIRGKLLNVSDPDSAWLIMTFRCTEQHRGFPLLKKKGKYKTNPEAAYGLCARPFNHHPFDLSLVSFFYLTVKAICFSSREFVGTGFFNHTHACCKHITKASQTHTHRALQSYITIQHYLKTSRHSWAGISSRG